LAGVYLNVKGREARGIVCAGSEAEALVTEIKDKLSELKDPLTGEKVIRNIYESDKVYTGPYKSTAPELIIGWKSGYRHSWETAVGATRGDVFSDNNDKWCGDHCVDRLEVPGVLFCNRKITWKDHPPHLADFAPTVLRLWNIASPRYMDGACWEICD
jgi:predicted AlkP superfamily phosphohydrolase/phosphomutase